MFRTRGLIFRKRAVYTVMVQYVSVTINHILLSIRLLIPTHVKRTIP
jgi:hypothetical protein